MTGLLAFVNTSTMVFTCEAKECFSHSDKLKKPDKYPWMKEVKWVKWPRNDKAAVARWKKLIHRTGKQLKINKRSRLCSLHFDRDDYDVWGTPLGDPKYFSWNNWGKPIRERSDSTIEKLDLARRRVGEPHPPVQSCLQTHLQVYHQAIVPDIGKEVQVISKQKADIGRK